MPSSALAPFMYQLQESLSNFDLNQFADRVDIQRWVGQLDLKTVGFVAVAIISVLLILQFFAKSYVGPARSLVASAAHAWQESRDLPPNHPARARLVRDVQSLPHSWHKHLVLVTVIIQYKNSDTSIINYRIV